MDNAYLGDTVLALGDQRFVLRFDWKALAALRTKLGADFTKKMDEALLNAAGDPETLADILAIGLHRNHPEMTAEAILDLSPPIADAIEAVGKALAFAYFGPRGAPKANPPKAAGK